MTKQFEKFKKWREVATEDSRLPGNTAKDYGVLGAYPANLAGIATIFCGSLEYEKPDLKPVYNTMRV
jgi:hypothetical protein